MNMYWAHQFTYFALLAILKDYITYPPIINLMTQKMHPCNIAE